MRRAYGGCRRALALSLAIALDGCNFNDQLDSLFAKSKNEPDITGSLRPRPTAKWLVESPPEVDLAIARAAVGEVLSNSGKDTAMLTCRDFLVSFVRNGSEAWM